MQTNIKLVKFGKDLRLQVKKIKLEGEPLKVEQMQSVCNKLPIAATPYYENNKQYVLVEHKAQLTKKEINIDEWVITLVDTNEVLTLSYHNKEDRNAIAEIYKRNLLQKINAINKFWRLDSPRIFYENTPYFSDNDYNVYRRFEVSDIDMGDNGLAFAVDISTAFFSKKSIEDFNKVDLDKLLRRQKEQKGTLLYKGGTKNSKCYFEKFDGKTTLSTAPAVNIQGERFASPFDYFKVKQPKFNVSEHDKAALVSFKNLENKVYVPANKLFLRLMNDVLPREIGNKDKINPIDRRNYLETNFWNLLGEKPFGANLGSIEKEYYKPNSSNSGIIPLPNILYKNKKTLFAPYEPNKQEYKKHYQKRRSFLESHKCFDVFGGNDGNNIYFVVPENVNEDVIYAYEIAIVEKISQLTGQDLEPIRITYDNYMSGIYELKTYDAGIVLFLFEDTNDEPATYYTIENELGAEWDLKRATLRELDKAYQKWERNRFDPTDRSWSSYIEMTTLSVIQKMGCTPFVVEASRFNYDMHLVIDVSEGGSHFVLSAQIWNKNMNKPIFPKRVYSKSGSKKESINKRILEDKIYEFLLEKSNDFKRHKIEKLLILRDGKFCEDENTAIQNAFSRLHKEISLSNKFSLDFVEYHKTTRKEVRFWENDDNVLEGTYFFINPTMAALATTGAGTLNQGTSDPIILISQYSANPNMKNIVEDVFLSSQFNFSNPRIAQRLALPVAKADDLLQEKRQQEIKRIR